MHVGIHFLLWPFYLSEKNIKKTTVCEIIQTSIGKKTHVKVLGWRRWLLQQILDYNTSLDDFDDDLLVKLSMTSAEEVM